LKDFSIFPKQQNLLHLFAYRDYKDQLEEALAAGELIYHQDESGKTPLKIALERQSFECTHVIFSFFKNQNNHLTLSRIDLEELMNYNTDYLEYIVEKVFTIT